MPAVLIVDQSLTIRTDLKEAFDAAGHSTVVCGTAAAARRELSTRAYDLILLDVLLPDADGLELLKELRQAPRTASTPVLLLASEAEVSSRTGSIPVGPVEYVGKPYNRTHLVRRAGQLLDRSGVSPNKLTVLVVDDSATFRHELGEALRQASTTAQSCSRHRSAFCIEPALGGAVREGSFSGGTLGPRHCDAVCS